MSPAAQPRGRARPGVPVLVALVLALVGPAAAAPALATGVSPSATDVWAEIVELGPAVLAPGTTLTVTVVVHNDGSAALSAPAVRLKLDSRLLASRDAVADWAVAGEDAPSGSRVAEQVVRGSVPPGGEVTVAVAVAADDLPLDDPATAWGPRGVAVSVLDAGFAQLALTRSHVVWYPGRSFSDPIRTTVLVPLTGAAPDVSTGVVAPALLADLTGEGARLPTVLRAASAPGIAWALDPALLASLASASDEDVPRARPYLAELRAAATDREIVSLAYGDPDVAALTHAGRQDVHALAEAQGRSAAQLLGVPARTDVAWPVSGSADQATLTTLDDAGRGAVVLSGGAQPPLDQLPFTPTGRSSIGAGAGAMTGLLVDTALSTTLAATGHTGADPASDLRERDTLAVQRLLADTAATTMERPSVSRHVLITAPRDWDPDPVVAAAALTALTAVPWVEQAPLADLLTADPPDVRRGPVIYPRADAAAELPAQGLRRAGSALDSVRAMASALSRPEQAVADAERSAVAASAVAWRDTQDRWRAQVDTVASSAAALTSGVTILEGSAINVLSARTDLPLTLASTLRQDVQVSVRLLPSSSRLVVRDDVRVSVAAGGQVRVLVPVRAVANGDTDVQVQLLTPAGTVLGAPVTLSVRVRADWENRGTFGFAVVTAMILVVGLVRTIRRGRRDAEAAVLTGSPDT